MALVTYLVFKKGFEAILGGDADNMPEAAFYNVGTLDDAYAKSKQL